MSPTKETRLPREPLDVSISASDRIVMGNKRDHSPILAYCPLKMEIETPYQMNRMR